MKKNDSVRMPSLSLSDGVVITSLIIMAPLYPVAVIASAIFFVPVFSLIGIVKCFQSRGYDIVDRDINSFKFLSVIIKIAFVIPIMILLIWSAIVTIVTFTISLPFGIYNYRRTTRSFRILKMFSTTGKYDKTLILSYQCAGKRIFWAADDLICGIIGAANRHNLCMIYYKSLVTIILIPLIKISIFCNFLLYDYESYLMNQTSEKLTYSDGTPVSKNDLITFFNNYISKADPIGPIDEWLDSGISFTANHQYCHSTNSTKTVPGFQILQNNLCISHTVKSEEFKDSPNPISPYVDHNFMQVWMFPYNLLYIINGYVEVNLTTDGCIEHPMWLISDTSSYLNMAINNNIDKLFDNLGDDFEKYFSLACMDKKNIT